MILGVLGKLESDLLRMNRELGVTVLNGEIKDFSRNGRGVHEVTVDLVEGEDEVAPPNPATGAHLDRRPRPRSQTPRQQRLRLSCDLLIDATGRRQLIARSIGGNVSSDPSTLYGLDTASSWVRVRGIDRALFDTSTDHIETISCRYYGTNHFMGKGHWCWQIPLAADEVSIGLVYHRQVIDAQSVNTIEGFLGFLETHHRVLHSIIQSGELVDFRSFPSLPFCSKRYISAERWSVIGDAAFFLLRARHILVQLESAAIVVASLIGAVGHWARNLRKPRNAFLASKEREFKDYRFRVQFYRNRFFVSATKAD